MRRPQTMTIPDDVIEDLRKIRADRDMQHLLHAYVTALTEAGWRYTSLAKAIGLTRQRIHQMTAGITEAQQSVEEYRLITGFALPVPAAPLIFDPLPKPKGARIRVPQPETTAKLRELHREAIRYRGTQRHRDAAQAFTALVWQAHVSEGASISGIAYALDITHAALQGRLVRYGYKTTTGKSSLYRPLRGRKTKAVT